MSTRKRYASCHEAFPSKKDADGKAVCCVCEGPLPPQCTRYCSEPCRERVYIVSNPSWARHKVHERDKGVCAACGCDTDKLQRILDLVVSGGRWSWPRSRHYDPEMGKIKRDMGFTTPHLWEMDHITPVCEGGGLCGLDNLRTLCMPCHKADTATLARRRADSKRTMPLFARTNNA